MHHFLNIKIKLFIVGTIFLLVSCESEPLPVSSSFLNDNSFMIEVFDSLVLDSSKTFQDISFTTGNSYRLYSGNLHGVDGVRAYFKINTSTIRSSKYCNIDPDGEIDNSIESINNIKIVLRSFTQLHDSDDSTLFFIDKTKLSIRGGFFNMYGWDGDSSIIFTDNISSYFENDEFTTIDPDSISYEQNTIHISPKITNEWCDYDCSLGDYFISIEYAPESNDYEPYIEFLSAQNYFQNSPIFRPSIQFLFSEFEDSIAYYDKFLLSESFGALLYNSSEQELSSIYYVHNDDLLTKSNILILKDMDADFNITINETETYLSEIDLGATESSIFSPGEYTINLEFQLNEEILDSITSIDFIMDNIQVISSNIDPSGDNCSVDIGNGCEGDGVWNSSGEESEDFEDLGVDQCPDKYEDSMGSCLCEYINNPTSCDELDEEVLVYNPNGTEGNGDWDEGGELFPDDNDTGSDGCSNEFEDGSGGCSETQNNGSIQDPNGDDKNLDPSDDNWIDY